MTKEGGDRVLPLKRYFVVPRYILPFYPIISEVPLRQEVVYNPLACQDAFRDDRMGMWRVHVHQRRLHVPRLSDDDDGSCRSPPPPPPPPPLPTYDVAQLQAGEAVGPEGVDANIFGLLYSCCNEMPTFPILNSTPSACAAAASKCSQDHPLLRHSQQMLSNPEVDTTPPVAHCAGPINCCFYCIARFTIKTIPESCSRTSTTCWIADKNHTIRFRDKHACVLQ